MTTGKFNLYPQNQLPTGFIYPEKVQEMSQTGDYPNIYPWWFVDSASKAGDLFYQNRNHDGRNLIPFAKVDDDRNDVACFDGDDHSGNPAVLMLILDDSGRAYSFRDFEDWMRSALADSSNS